MAKGTIDSLTYLNEDILYLKNRTIQEYDIIEGGYSVARQLNLLPAKFLKRIENMTKHERHVEIGKYSKDNKEFTKELFEGFREFMLLFREFNEIDDDKVLSVKKDSITLYNSPVKRLKFKHVVFSLRETSTSYLLLGKKEFFFNSKTDGFFFKGLDHGIEAKDNLIEEIKVIMGFNEYKDKRFVFEYLQELRECYVKLELAHTYYKELNAIGEYRLKDHIGNNDVYFEFATDDQLEMLDISHNYENYLLPLIRIMV
jgi:hypothetical protein